MERKPSKALEGKPSRTLQRKPSKTLERIRKLSDTIRNVIVPSAAKPAEHHHKRRLSLDYIGKPRPHPAYTMDGWLSNEEPEKGPSESTRPRRPERPREEDLPYGAKGAMPIAMMSTSTLDLTATQSIRSVSSKASNAVPFPSTPRKADPTNPKKKQHSAREPRHPRAGSEAMAQYRFPPEPRRDVFSPFATVGRDASRRTRPGTAESSSSYLPSSSSTRVGSPTSFIERDKPHAGKGKERASARRDDTYKSNEPATVRRQGAIRRPSRTSEATLPPAHLRHRFGRSDEALIQPRPTPLLQRSQSAAVRHTPSGMSPPAPGSPAGSFDTHRMRARPRDVPSDVVSRSHIPTIISVASSEYSDISEPERMLIPSAPVATPRIVEKLRANMPMQYSPAPRDVKVREPAGLQRASSHKAEFVPASRPPPRAMSSSASLRSVDTSDEEQDVRAESITFSSYFAELQRGLDADQGAMHIPPEHREAVRRTLELGTRPLQVRQKDDERERRVKGSESWI